MEKLSWPTLFCNTLIVSPEGQIAGYKLRQPDGKRKAVAAFRSMDYGFLPQGIPITMPP